MYIFYIQIILHAPTSCTALNFYRAERKAVCLSVCLSVSFCPRFTDQGLVVYVYVEAWLGCTVCLPRIFSIFKMAEGGKDPGTCSMRHEVFCKLVPGSSPPCAISNITKTQGGTFGSVLVLAITPSSTGQSILCSRCNQGEFKDL